MKYGVFVTRAGYFQIDAGSEAEARELSAGVPFSHVSWNEDWTIDAVQEEEFEDD